MRLLISLLAMGIAVQNAAAYKAATVEFSPPYIAEVTSRNEATNLQLSNLQRMDPFVAEAKDAGAQIIVFPEYGLQSWPQSGSWSREMMSYFVEAIPMISEETAINPCKDADKLNATIPVTVAASCLARKYNIVLVIDMGDIAPCSPETSATGTCDREDGQLMWNTAVAFDEQGVLLAKYHKKHLYGDEYIWYDAGKDTVGFTTSFGVDFGMFICFDIFWEDASVRPEMDYVFPTYWVNILVDPPFAIDAQKNWSATYGTNFLASNNGADGRHSSGSGIYHEGNPLAVYFNPTEHPSNKLLIADVPLIK